MPALIANTVTLEEVLEVRAGPLIEEELWSVLAQSCEALYDVFVSGKARKRHFGTYTITPATILLCHNGKVKFSLDGDRPNDRSFTAPEIYTRKAFPSEAALEKICVYSLGMSLYHAAEFEVAVGKPISLHESLENILLTMCEDSARARSSLTEVLQECHSHYKRKNYKDVVSSLVESLLGDEMPDIELEDAGFDNEAFQNDTSDNNHIDEELYPSRISPVLDCPRHLPTPPLPQISTSGQATSAELIGSNHRHALTPPLRQRSTSPRLNDSRNLPPSLEKYKSYLEESRSKRSMSASLNGLDQLDSKPPAKHQRMTNARHSPHYQKVTEEHDYNSQPPPKLPADLERRLKVKDSRNGLGNGLRRYSSVNSVTSNSSSTASGPRSSMFSDGRSSSAISLTQGSYALESYITDGYESDFFLNSMGSSVSRNRFRNERQTPSLRDQQYVSVSDLGRPPPGPNKNLPAAKHFKSLPDITKEQRRSSREKDNSPTKTFFGPEFVMITEDPEKSTVNITPNSYLKKDAQKKGGSQSRKMVTVVALNGQKLQLMAEVSMTTKELYEHVIKFLGITEKSFFGLAKLEDDEVIFLELDVKLSKYAPPKWKEPKGEMVEFILYFRVKFYVEHSALLSHLSSRHQFYLQLRKDLLEGRLYCHEEAAFVLAGLALQAETGDYDESLDQEYFLVEHYLHPRVINKVSVEYAVSQLPEFHQNFAGLSEEQAELDFIEEAQKLPEYGIHFYKVQVNKKSDSEKLYLGICVRGITVYESTGHVKSPIHKHSWPLTKKISFKKKKFFIEPRSNPDGVKLTFYTNHYKKSKYLLSMCTAFHRFQMKMRTRLASIEHEVALDFAAEKHQQQSVDGPKKISTYERTRPPPSFKHYSLDTPRDNLIRSVSQEYNTEDLQKDSYEEMSVDINHNIGNHGNNKTTNRMLSTTSMHDETRGKHDELPYVIDSTLNELRKQEPNQEDDVKERLLPSQELEVSKPRDVLASPEREIRVIKLRKEPFKGLGITVLGGENSKRLDLGIYVKSIADGGAAAKDGRLKAGDRILAVNGNSLGHVTHEKAVSLLKTTSSTVELVVSQSPHNVSALDLSNIPSAASTNEEPQTLEVKPLITPPQHGKRRHVESRWSSDTQSPTESPASTYNFPSEDEPVTMISKSIPSLSTSPPSNQTSEATAPKLNKDTTKVEESISEPVTVTTVQSLNSVPSEMNSQSKFTPPLVETRLSSLDSHQSEMSSESYTAGSERSADLDISDKSFVVELEKVNGSLGLSVTGGINTTVKYGAIYVKSLILNGPADRNGRVRVGDRILEVNGISLKSVTHKQAVEIIKRAPQHCRILIDRSIHINVPTSIKKTSSRNQTSDQPFVVELRKGIGGLGLSLVGGRDADPQHGGLLRIKKMFPGQPAALSNQLLVGDIVLEVNGNSLENASHQDAINLIRHEPSVVRLLVKRCPSSIPEVLLSRASSDASDIDPVQLLNDIQSKLRNDAVKSPPQVPQPMIMRESRPTLNASNQNSISDNFSNQENLPDRTEVWVKQESPRVRPRGVDYDRSLTHQLSDPLARLPRHIEHEPVTSSNSLPGKFALKSCYFDKVSDEKPVKKKTSVSSVTSEIEKRDSVKIVSDSDLPLLFKNIKSQDSLHRTMSPRAPLAEYDESDIDEGIMISVDDGTVMNISDDSDKEGMDKTLTNDNQEISSDKDDSDNVDNNNISVGDDENHFTRTYDESKEISLITPDQTVLVSKKYDEHSDQNHNTLEAFPPPPINVAENSDNYSIDDNTNSDEDIDSVLELLSAVQQGSQDETANTVEKLQNDRIILDIQEPEQPLLNNPSIAAKINIYSTESQPELKSTEMTLIETHDDKSDSSYKLFNGELDDSDDESLHSTDINEYQDIPERDQTINDSCLQVEEDTDKSSLTPKEELVTVELEKGDSGGLGFTLAGGADTMGGCFVRDIIGDPAKSDGRLQKGDQILQVDDIDIREMKHMAAVNILRATKKNVKLIVLRRPTLVVNDGCSLETVNLTRTSRGRIGLLLTEGEDGVILVDDVVPGEPAAAEGNLKHGDRIVEIGGRKVDGVGFLAARQYLDASRPVVQLLVERRNQAAFSKYSMGGASLEQSFSLSEDLPANLSQSDGENSDQQSDTEQQADEVIKVELEKGPQGFGFSLAPSSSESYASGIFIKTISPGSVAEKDGRLQVGDQLLTVDGEDVRDLSHARVIGMLRKVTTTVTLEIRRPGDSARPVKQASTTTTTNDARRSPSLNSVDLDITLEDKKNLTGSSEVKDDDDIVDLLSTVPATTTEAAPTSGSPTKSELNRRDTDSVLSSLLNSIGSPTFQSNTNNLKETNLNDSDSDMGSPSFDMGSTSAGTGSPILDSASPILEKGPPSVDMGSPSPILDNRTSKSIPADSLQRFSSGSLEDKRLSDSSADHIKTDSEESSDSDYDDVDVFDMLHDNSETNKKKDATISRIIDLPPPLPTTPIPSDDEDVPPPLPRKESLNMSSDDGWSSESNLSLQPKVNGFVSLHSSSSEEEMIANPNGRLVDVISDGRYTGHKLKMLIGALQTKLSSNAPSDEFKALREIKPTDNCDAAKHPDNKDKNRYRNVLPFNSTRVRLSGENNEDYINASHIRVPVGQDTYHYIAAQGPLPNTIQDFWQMVWEQGVEVIAMVTLEKEGGKIKCTKYWPNSPDMPLNLLRFQVSLVEEKISPSFIERTLSLKHRQSGQSIEVTHLNFTTWPDHGVPKCSVEMVQFVTYMRNLTSSQAPILVHCSAGIGRTGALITVDVSLGLIKRDQIFDVDRIIRILREQRQGMIQTKDQYVFCYTACLEVLRSLKS